MIRLLMLVLLAATAAGQTAAPFVVALAWKSLLALGVDGILTDDPYRLVHYLKQMGLRR